MAGQYMVKSAFQSPDDEFTGSGKRPVVFDIIGPDRVTSLLPPDLKLVLHVNPTTMGFTYAKTIARQQTMAGFVEYHWGSNPTEIAFNMATGGFVRLYSGLSNITGPTPSNDKLPPGMQAIDVGGTRRETIAYDKYLDMLALFHNNGSIYDSRGNIAFQGQILVTYDGGAWWGWFTTFTVEETAEKPYQFTLTAAFTVDREVHQTKSVFVQRDTSRGPTNTAPTAPDGAAVSTTPTRGAEADDISDLESRTDKQWERDQPPAPTNANTRVPAPARRSTSHPSTPSRGGSATGANPAPTPPAPATPAASPPASPAAPAAGTPVLRPAGR